MKKVLLAFSAILFCFFAFNASATPNQGNQAGQQAQGAKTIYFFWSKDCPHCVQAHPFLEKLKRENGVRVLSFEISNPSNQQRFAQMARAHGRSTTFVPTFFVGNQMIVGFSGEQSTGAEIRNALR